MESEMALDCVPGAALVPGGMSSAVPRLFLLPSAWDHRGHGAGLSPLILTGPAVL